MMIGMGLALLVHYVGKDLVFEKIIVEDTSEAPITVLRIRILANIAVKVTKHTTH